MKRKKRTKKIEVMAQYRGDATTLPIMAKAIMPFPTDMSPKSIAAWKRAMKRRTGKVAKGEFDPLAWLERGFKLQMQVRMYNILSRKYRK